eukprot:TRINITY_DN9599_c0_g1_i2.p1 TRINITY_DN9599_c0_g1~~TRINITY_DN9599_c0_g1_i2.p1  ORF type:complete len:361 (+),score=73.69 TRINITY_DN9599_c0_g1_i2:82-1164(+)
MFHHLQRGLKPRFKTITLARSFFWKWFEKKKKVTEKKPVPQKKIIKPPPDQFINFVPDFEFNVPEKITEGDLIKACKAFTTTSEWGPSFRCLINYKHWIVPELRPVPEGSKMIEDAVRDPAKFEIPEIIESPSDPNSLYVPLSQSLVLFSNPYFFENWKYEFDKGPNRFVGQKESDRVKAVLPAKWPGNILFPTFFRRSLLQKVSIVELNPSHSSHTTFTGEMLDDLRLSCFEIAIDQAARDISSVKNSDLATVEDLTPFQIFSRFGSFFVIYKEKGKPYLVDDKIVVFSSNFSLGSYVESLNLPSDIPIHNMAGIHVMMLSKRENKGVVLNPGVPYEVSLSGEALRLGLDTLLKKMVEA